MMDGSPESSSPTDCGGGDNRRDDDEYPQKKRYAAAPPAGDDRCDGYHPGGNRAVQRGRRGLLVRGNRILLNACHASDLIGGAASGEVRHRRRHARNDEQQKSESAELAGVTPKEETRRRGDGAPEAQHRREVRQDQVDVCEIDWRFHLVTISAHVQNCAAPALIPCDRGRHRTFM